VWDKTVGGGGRDYLTSLVVTADGGCLLGGYSNSNTSYEKSQDVRGTNDGYDYWVVKLDKNGSIDWDKNHWRRLQRLPEGATRHRGRWVLLAGTSCSEAGYEKSEDSRGGDCDYWILKVDKHGNKVWDKTIGGSTGDDLTALLATPDGGYLLGGNSHSDAGYEKSEDKRWDQNDIHSESYTKDYWVVKVDNHGNKAWDKTIGGAREDQLAALALSLDGGYVVGGTSQSRAGFDKSENTKGSLDTWEINPPDYWIVKLDSNSRIGWDKTIGGAEQESLSFLMLSTDGGYFLGGYSDSYAGFDKGEDVRESKYVYDYWVVKLAPELGNNALRINAGGGKHKTVYDQFYQPDAYFTGGTVSTQVQGAVLGTEMTTYTGREDTGPVSPTSFLLVTGSTT
jgi:hypothetical protein